MDIVNPLDIMPFSTLPVLSLLGDSSYLFLLTSTEGGSFYFVPVYLGLLPP